MSKNYLDIAANGNLVKKSIEELCYAISQNPEENSGKYFKLKYDTDNEHTNELDRVSIVLETIDSDLPKINGNLGQLIMSDGNGWAKTSNLISSYDSSAKETRIGPFLSTNKFLITGSSTHPGDSATYNLSLSGRTNVAASGYSILNMSGSSSLKMSDYSHAYFKDSGLLQLSGNSNVSFDSNNLTILDGDTRFTMHDSSAMDLTRDAQIFAHGPVQLHIDDGKYYSRITVYSRLYYSDIGGRPSPDLTPEEIRNNSFTTISGTNYNTLEEISAAGYVLEKNNSFSKYSSYYYLSDTYISTALSANYDGNNSTDYYLEAAAFRMHDKALFSMDGGASIIAHDTPKIYFQDNATAYIKGNSYTNIQDNSLIRMQDSPYINMTDGSSIIMQNKGTYDPCLCMNGGTILFNSQDNYSKVPYDPYLIADPNQFTYIGQAATGVTTNYYSTYNYPNSPQFYIPKMKLFEESFTFVDENATKSIRYFDEFTESNKEALYSALREAGYGSSDVRAVSGNSSVTSVALEKGYSYTVSDFYYSEGSVNAFGDTTTLIPQNNIPRFKIANETMIMIDTYSNSGANFIKIGAADKLLQIIKTGNIFEQMSGNAHSEMHDNSKFIMRGPSNRPWAGTTKGHCDESWVTPIKPTNSPVLGMYDISQFIMRGKWEYNEEDKPTDWNSTIEKIEGQPLLEIIEDAEVRITGNSVLKMNDFSIEATSEGISFSSGEDSVIFSIEELKKLKTFLMNSEIEE